jgi:hypothetical protein
LLLNYIRLVGEKASFEDETAEIEKACSNWVVVFYAHTPKGPHFAISKNVAKLIYINRHVEHDNLESRPESTSGAPADHTDLVGRRHHSGCLSLVDPDPAKEDRK